MTATNKPTDLTKPNSTSESSSDTFSSAKTSKTTSTSETNSTTYNGVIEKDNKTYVFTSDLKLDGYKKIVQKLKDKSIKPFYITSKTASGNIWPITNSLVGRSCECCHWLKIKWWDKIEYNGELCFNWRCNESNGKKL